MPPTNREVETVAAILERASCAAIQEWYKLIQTDELLMSVSMSRELRCGHLPQVFRDLVARLLSSRRIGTNGQPSAAASSHGLSRRRQGYSAAMLVEESRMLQISIFSTLQNNLANIDFSLLLIAVMTIADEVDSQLSQAMKSFSADSSPGSAA